MYIYMYMYFILFLLLTELNSLQQSHSSLQGELQEKERIIKRNERRHRQTREELSLVEETMNTSMVPKSELESLARRLEEKVK